MFDKDIRFIFRRNMNVDGRKRPKERLQQTCILQMNQRKAVKEDRLGSGAAGVSHPLSCRSKYCSADFSVSSSMAFKSASAFRRAMHVAQHVIVAAHIGFAAILQADPGDRCRPNNDAVGGLCFAD